MTVYPLSLPRPALFALLPKTAVFAQLQALKDGLGASPLMEKRQKFLEAVDLQGMGKYREAKKCLVEFLRDHPEDVGGNFMLGRTRFMLGEFNDAYHAYSVCIALKPRFAPGYYSRALLSHQQHDYKQALVDLDMALRVKPDLMEAHLVRSIVYYELGKCEEALKDIQRVIEDRRSPAPVRAWFIRALIHTRMGDKEKAAEDRRYAMKQKATDAPSLIAQGNARLLAKDTRAALADYVAAEEMNPLAIEPIQNQASVEGEVFDRPARAVEILDRLLKRHPDHIPSLCGRAVYLARAGRTDDALREAKRILELEDTPFTQYRVACVYALASAEKPALADEALRLIAHALQNGEGHAHLEVDPDLATLRESPAFGPLLQYVKHLRSLQKPAKPRAGL